MTVSSARLPKPFARFFSDRLRECVGYRVRTIGVPNRFSMRICGYILLVLGVVFLALFALALMGGARSRRIPACIAGGLGEGVQLLAWFSGVGLAMGAMIVGTQEGRS